MELIMSASKIENNPSCHFPVSFSQLRHIPAQKPIICATSSLVHTIANIKVSMQLACGTLAMKFFSSSLFGQSSEDNWKRGAKGGFIGFSSLIWNPFSAFLSKLLCKSDRVPFLQSLWIFIPRIYLAGPRSFIANLSLKYLELIYHNL